MPSRRLRAFASACALSGLVASGCASHQAPPAAPPPPPQPKELPVVSARDAFGPRVPLAPDRIGELIGSAEREFAAGEAELKAGRLVAAREHFDQAVDLLLGASGGARNEARLAAAFERLLDRISALDVLALRDGDGFTEAKSEPAVIDELLGAATFDRPAPTLTTAETVADDLARTPHDLPIAMNDRVLSFIELFQGRLRQFMQDGLNRGMQYLPMIQSVFKAEGIPLDLAYVPLVESAFKPNALSRVSARGMWQFMQGTALEQGLKQNWFLDERSDPEKATRAAADYLKSLSQMFDGDWNLALASYNAGPGRIAGAIRRSKATDYWALTATSKYLPRETREYVPMIQAAIIIAKNPARYGFDVVPAAPLAFDRVRVPGALDLRILAEWAGVTTEELQVLNPELRRTVTPMGEHDLKVPLGTAATIQAKLASADASLFRTFRFHTVKKGETVTTIARKYNIKLTDLREANNLTAKSRVRVNQTLQIPERTTTALPTSTTARATTPARPAPARSAPVSTTYTVRSGDTLFSIARRFDTTVDALKQLNRLSSDRITIGARLTVRR